jgi:hypothetical protein
LPVRRLPASPQARRAARVQQQVALQLAAAGGPGAAAAAGRHQQLRVARGGAGREDGPAARQGAAAGSCRPARHARGGRHRHVSKGTGCPSSTQPDVGAFACCMMLKCALCCHLSHAHAHAQVHAVSRTECPCPCTNWPQAVCCCSVYAHAHTQASLHAYADTMYAHACAHTRMHAGSTAGRDAADGHAPGAGDLQGGRLTVREHGQAAAGRGVVHCRAAGAALARSGFGRGPCLCAAAWRQGIGPAAGGSAGPQQEGPPHLPWHVHDDGPCSRLVRPPSPRLGSCGSEPTSTTPLLPTCLPAGGQP